jgi:phospholipase/lecithinase/hemolysin
VGSFIYVMRISLTLCHFRCDDLAVQYNPSDLHIGSIIRSRAKMVEQQVNFLLAKYNNFIDESFILSESFHLCMIRL